MTDHRDFKEPYADKAGPDERHTRWILIACFGILVLASIAFASIARLGDPVTALSMAEARREPPQAVLIRPGPLQMPPDAARPQ